MDIKKAGAVVVCGNATPYLLVGQQGTNSQGKFYVEGIERPLSVKNAVIAKSAYAAATAGVFTLTVPNPAAGATLTIVAKGELPDAPSVDKDIFVNCDLGPTEDLSQAEWVTKIVSTFNGNKSAAKLFTASEGGAGQVVFTENGTGGGHKIYVRNAPATTTLVETTISAKNKGLTAAQVTKLVETSGVETEFPVTVLGSFASTDNFNVYSIEVPANTIMKTFGFRENKPLQFLIIVDTDLAVTSNGTNFPSAFEQLIKFDSSNYAPLYGTADFTDATCEADDEIFTKAAHGFVTGDQVLCTQKTNGTGLTVGQAYSVVRLSSSTFKLKSNNVDVAITLDGTGIGFRKISHAPLPEGVTFDDATVQNLLCPEFVV